MGFHCGSAGKESACNAGDWGSIPGLGRSPGEGKGYSFQYSNLEESMDCIVHGVTKSQTGLSDFHFHFHDTARREEQKTATAVVLIASHNITLLLFILPSTCASASLSSLFNGIMINLYF